MGGPRSFWDAFLDHDYSSGEQRLAGHCPICDRDTTYLVHGPWFRDQMVCPGCEGHSIPRERALARVIAMMFPGWRDLDIHEAAAAADRGSSAWLRGQARHYSRAKFDPSQPRGSMVDGVRNEDLERLTLPSKSVDLLVHLDVMEHVNQPDLVMREAARVLRDDGACVFTTPTFKHLVASRRRALYHEDGSVELFGPAEYHGSEDGGRTSLVTYHYGYDLPELILRWSGLRTDVIRSVDPDAGVMGEHTEVYVCRKVGRSHSSG